MITAITPTGDRPLAFELCQKWMARQTVQPDQWIVVDDGKEAMNLKNCDYIRREPKQDDPKHTLNINLLTAIPYIKGDVIFIIEDDDYYAPDYIEKTLQRLGSNDIVGYKHAKYYHVEGLYYEFPNTDYSSLCQTAFKSNVLPDFIKELEVGKNMLDVRFWRNSKRRKKLYEDNQVLQLGIKGLKGRQGIGIGYKKTFDRYIKDENFEKIKEWIKSDAFYYIKRQKTKQRKDRVFIVGGGSSLEGFDFSLLDNEDTIAINESFFSLKNPKYFITVDYQWLERKKGTKEYNEFIKSNSTKFFIMNMAASSQFKYKNGAYYHYGDVLNTNNYDIIIKAKKQQPFGDYSCFAHGENSGYCALQLAIILGYKEIYLLGFDMRSDIKTHYHNKYDNQIFKRGHTYFTQKEWYKREFEIFYQIFKMSLKEYTGESDIYSCSEISRLNDLIKYRDIETVLKRP